MAERHTIVVDGVRISYLERGSARPGTPSIVLLHGLIATAATFLPLMRLLSVDRHVIAIDMPGSGLSECLPGGDASLNVMAATVAAVLKQLELDRPILFGHSHGGAVTLRLASQTPELVRGIVLVSPAHPFFRDANNLIRFYLSPPGRVFAHALPWIPRWIQLIGFRRMAGPGSWTDMQQFELYLGNLRTPGMVPHMLRLLGTWRKDFSELGKALAGKLRVPTLLLWGDRDRAVPHVSAKMLCRHIDNATLLVFEGIGHRPAEEVPERCAEAIEKWFAGLSQSPNVSAVQERTAAAIMSSLDAGDSGMPAKK